MNDKQREIMIEQATTAWRPRDRMRTVQATPGVLGPSTRRAGWRCTTRSNGSG